MRDRHIPAALLHKALVPTNLFSSSVNILTNSENHQQETTSHVARACKLLTCSHLDLKTDPNVKKKNKRMEKSEEPTAMTRVLSTVELLEQILVETFPAERIGEPYGTAVREIFVSQRVSRLWRDVIVGSCQLQRLLLIQPTTHKEENDEP